MTERSLKKKKKKKKKKSNWRSLFLSGQFHGHLVLCPWVVLFLL